MSGTLGLVALVCAHTLVILSSHGSSLGWPFLGQGIPVDVGSCGLGEVCALDMWMPLLHLCGPGTWVPGWEVLVGRWRAVH